MAITVNLRYEYYLPFGEEKAVDDTSETILLIDSWENQEAIDLHHASPMMKTIRIGTFSSEGKLLKSGLHLLQ